MAGRVTHEQVRELERRLDRLQEEVDENRRLNERLADLIDAVAEVLAPAADGDAERLRAALEKLDQTRP